MAAPSAPSHPRPAGALAKAGLGVIFLTILIDLLGFTIIFPLFPAILEYYLRVDGGRGFLGWLVGRIDDFARLTGSHGNYREVLFGGALGSSTPSCSSSSLPSGAPSPTASAGGACSFSR